MHGLDDYIKILWLYITSFYLSWSICMTLPVSQEVTETAVVTSQVFWN